MPVAAAASSRRTTRKKSRKSKKNKTPRTYKPEGMSLEQWQIALRREFGREQKFKLVNAGRAQIFSEFLVTNPQTKRTYRITIRGRELGDNHCTCPDFAVNTLGTCKHIEFTLARLERRGAKAALKRGYRPAYSEVYLRYGGQREVALRRGIDCPADLDSRVARFLDDRDVLRPQTLDDFESFVQELRSGDHDVRLRDDALAFVAQWRDQEGLRKRIAKVFPDGPDSAEFDRLVNVPMYPYQRKGAFFAASAGRCLLADDMGLGKTLQAIAATEILARAAGIERVLIICPTSLKHQWKQEIERFSARDAMTVDGMTAARHACYDRASFYKITNYEAVHRDLEKIGQWSPDLVILDEAQRIKNWKTRTAQTVKQISAQHAIVLTGTPLENRLEELHSIVEFVDRFRLGPSFRFLAEHQKVDQDGRVVGYQNLSTIGKTLAPVMMRRTKAEVLKDLPHRLEKHLFIPMKPEQRRHHDENRDIVAKIVAKWRRMRFLSESDQKRLQMALQNMRMACDSTYLLDPASEVGDKPDELIRQLNEFLETPDTKVVIFSQWLRSHELIASRLEKLKQKFVLFHGSVPGSKRKDLVAQFKEDDRCRVFLSTDAGGVGLNLQNASVVFNMDLPWNPAVLEQRIGRVHRLGQHRPVNVVNFVTADSIEQSMLDVLKFKTSLFAGVLEGGQDEVFMGGTRLNKFMESVESVTTAAPAVRVSAPSADQTPVMPISTPSQEPIAVEPDAEPPAPPDAAQPGMDLLSQVVSAGRTLLDGLAALLQPPQGGNESTQPTGMPAGRIHLDRDEKTGESFIRLPIPSEEVLGRALLWVNTLAGAMQKTP